MDNLVLNILVIVASTFIGFSMLYLLNGRYKGIVTGVMSSIAAVLCMTFPFTLAPGQIYDLRSVPLLFGILYGGYSAGIVVTVVTFLFRYSIGGSGFIQTIYTFPPVLLVTFSLVRRFRHFAKVQKVLVAIGLNLTLVLINILITVIEHPISRWQMLLCGIYVLIQGLSMGLLVYLVETIQENIRMRQRLHQMDKIQVTNDLAAAIAHEIRNPLTVCQGFLQLLHEEITDTSHSRYVRTIESELNRATNIINNYLAFTKPQIKSHYIGDVGTVLRYIVRTIEPYATEHQVIIQTKIACDLYALIDDDKLNQALINIVKNGIEAMTEGGTMSIIAHRQAQMIAVDIIDTGVGMTAEEMTRLGHPFYSTKENGTGMGLMTSYRFIHLMEGDIVVKSAKGRGTQFSVYLPLQPTSTKINASQYTARRWRLKQNLGRPFSPTKNRRERQAVEE